MSFKKRCKEIYVAIKDTITHTEIGKMLVFMFSKGVFSTFITSTIKDPNVTGINIKKEKSTMAQKKRESIKMITESVKKSAWDRVLASRMNDRPIASDYIDLLIKHLSKSFVL